jgi:uncharacterized membrane protein
VIGMDSEKISEHIENRESLFKKLSFLFIIGFIIIFAGIIILVIAAVLSGGSTDVGGVIFIWFIPIVFGVGPNASWMVFFAIILAVLSIIVFLILHRGMERNSTQFFQFLSSSLP